MKKILFSVLLILLFIPARAQVIDVKGKVKDKTVERADQHVDEGIDKGLDAVEEGVGGLFKKKDKAGNKDEEQTSEDTETRSVDQDNNDVTDGKQFREINSYSKFDFISGETVIFYDDFSGDPVGEFPAKWNTNNSAEVVTIDGFAGKWLKMPSEGGNYFPELSLTFPENVTVEFDLLFPDDNSVGISYYSEEQFDVDAYGVPGEAGVEADMESSGDLGFSNYAGGDNGINSTSYKGRIEPGKIAHISVWIQNSRFRMYIDDAKVFDIPKGVYTGYKYNRFRFVTFNSKADVYITNVRIAAGAPDTRKQLITEGKLVTRGILFDVNSDKIKPESYGCIKDIATVLKENPSVSVMIVGHTDSDGNDAFNLDLSKRRANSVKAFLAKEFGIDEARMKTDGKGENQPVENNATAEGKAQNRRVEFIKL